MAFTASFIYQAIDKVTPTIEKINRASKAAKRMAVKNFAEQSRAAENYKRSLNSIAAASLKMTAGIAVGLAIITRTGSKYEDALASLSAITGISGDGLQKLSGNIKDTSKIFGLGATDIANGMALIGSEQPSLLKTPSLLLEVARSAAVLSKATGQDFASAGEDLARVMNQFVIPAERSLEVVNALAAGSLEGSALVPQLTQSMISMAGASKLVNLNFTDTIAVLEGVSGTVKGSEAGIQLRNIFTKLATAGRDDLNPAIVGLQTALENLSTLTIEEKLKVFNQENIKGVQAMIANREQIVKMTQSLKGTSTAQDQMAIKTDTLTERLKSMRAEVGVELINAYEELKPSLIEFLGFVKTSIPVIIEFVKENKGIIKTFAVLAPTVFLVSKALLFLKSTSLLVSGAWALMKASKIGVFLLSMAGKTKIAAIAMRLLSTASAKWLVGLTVIIFTVKKLIDVWNSWKALKAADDEVMIGKQAVKTNEQIRKRIALLNSLREAQGKSKTKIAEFGARTRSILKEKGVTDEDADFQSQFASARLQAINERVEKADKDKFQFDIDNQKATQSELKVDINVKSAPGTEVPKATIKGSSDLNLVGKSTAGIEEQ